MARLHKKIITVSVLWGFATLLPSSVLAGPVDELMKRYDYNSNGKLEAEEVGPVARRNFASLDKNADQQLGKWELIAHLRAEKKKSDRIKERSPKPLSSYKGPIDQQLRAALADMQEKLELPGAALLVYGPEGRRHELNVGEINTHSVLPLASASKWLSAGVLLKLVEEGVFSLDEPLPELESVDARWKGVSLRHLLQLTAGFGPGHAFAMSPTTAHKTLIDSLQQDLAAEPGTAFYYGGTGLQLAAYVAELRTGKTWTQLFDDTLAKPLGMKDSLYSHPIWHRDQAVITAPNIGGGLRSNAADYIKYLSSLWHSHKATTPTKGLSPHSLSLMREPYAEAVAEGQRPPMVSKDWRYGLGAWCESYESTEQSMMCSRMSSAGAYGSIPWVDFERGEYGVLITLGSIDTVRPYFNVLQQILAGKQE